jgi:dethiobiotin synthetase
MRSNILFVTGTDTGVGKTSVCCALVRVLIEQGINVHVIKPIETGCLTNESGLLIPSDGEKLWEASSKVQSLEEVVPYRFKDPVAPQVAAEVSGEEFDISELIEKINVAASNCDLLVVEGAGGLLVPLVGNYTYANLAKDLRMKVLVVIGSKLGALNHASLTFEVIRSRGLNVLGYVLNDLFAKEQAELGYDLAINTNHNVIKRIAHSYGFDELASVPYNNNHSEIFLNLTTQVKARFGLEKS